MWTSLRGTGHRLVRRVPPGRYDRLDSFRRLDPEKEYHHIYKEMVLKEFPWDITMGIQLGFYRNFAVPSISALLDRTGEMSGRTRKRLDDTAILIYEIVNHGFEHPRGRAAIARMNRLHRDAARRASTPDAPWVITNDEFRYVLGTFFIPAGRWVDRYGWRPLCCHERTAMFTFYAELGRLMAIKDLPRTYREFERWFDWFEKENFRYAAQNRRQWDATRDELTELFVNWLPGPLAGPGRRAAAVLAHALLDDTLRDAVGADPAPEALRRMVDLGMRIRGGFVRWLPPRREPTYEGEFPTPSYPDGYDIATVGPVSRPERTN